MVLALVVFSYFFRAACVEKAPEIHVEVYDRNLPRRRVITHKTLNLKLDLLTTNMPQLTKESTKSAQKDKGNGPPRGGKSGGKGRQKRDREAKTSKAGTGSTKPSNSIGMISRYMTRQAGATNSATNSPQRKKSKEGVTSDEEGGDVADLKMMEECFNQAKVVVEANGVSAKETTFNK